MNDIEEKIPDEPRQVALLIQTLVNSINYFQAIANTARDSKDRAAFGTAKAGIRSLNKGLILLGREPPVDYSEALTSIADFPDCTMREYFNQSPAKNREWLISEWTK